MDWRTGLRKGRSHLIFAMALILAGAILVRLDDDQLNRSIAHDCANKITSEHCPGAHKAQP